MSKYASKTSTSALLSERDLEMLASGRRFEREDLVKMMEESAKKNMKRSPEYALAVGFILEIIKGMPDA